VKAGSFVTVLAALLTLGRPRAAATVVRDGKNFLVALTIKGNTKNIRIRPGLTLV